MPKRVVAIDDDVAFLDLLQVACESGGHGFFPAQNGSEGLKLARETRPDFVLLDLMMPGIHGYEVCKGLRADPQLKDAKIVICSAKGYPVDKSAAMAAGADHYLVKPFAIHELMSLLQ